MNKYLIAKKGIRKSSFISMTESFVAAVSDSDAFEAADAADLGETFNRTCMSLIFAE